MKYQPKEELAETLEKARRGDTNASQELLSHHCKVWTYEELQALNCYRKGRDEHVSKLREKSNSTFYCKKDFQSMPEVVTVKWFESFNNEYDLYMIIFPDETEQLWMFKQKPICNVTDWSHRDVKDEGRAWDLKGKRLSKKFFKPKHQPQWIR